MEMNSTASKFNWILLGLLMLVPGLLKLLVMGPSAVTGMLSGLGFPAATFFAWVLIIAEIASGAAILAKWKLEYVVWVPIVVLIVAAFTASWGNWASIILHLTAATNYWMLGSK